MYFAKSKALYKFLLPVANTYANLSGYRQLGLRYDDLLMDENETVQEALKRVPENEFNLRTLRIRNAYQLSTNHKILPKDKWVKSEDDVRYLSPYVEQVAAEESEREMFDALKIVGKDGKPSINFE
ncbi:20067_t:CDS:2 [Entrophospora sp. SA101]|nr:20067_t:CDS:2 [Entrophospora sp. SA101]